MGASRDRPLRARNRRLFRPPQLRFRMRDLVMIKMSDFALRVETGKVINEFNEWLSLMGPADRVQYGGQRLVYRGVVVVSWADVDSGPTSGDARGWAALIDEARLLTVCTDNEDETLEALLAQIDDALPVGAPR